jgi:hypothetical protein
MRSAVNERGFGARWLLLPETRARGLLEDTEAYDEPCAESGCEAGLAAIRRAHALVRESGAQFMLVNVPEFAERWPGPAGADRYRRYLATLQQFAENEGFPFIDVTNGDPAAFANEREFSDYYHMSPIGAKRFTTELAIVLAPFIAARESGREVREVSPPDAAPAAARRTARGSPGRIPPEP